MEGTSMSAESLDKVLRLSSQGTVQGTPEPVDELRSLVRAVHLALSEACQDLDPAHAAELVYAAAAIAGDLNTVLYGDGMSDWVEATSAPDEGTQVLLAGAATAPYGDVPYADPGYIGGRKRYPIDEKHVTAAWSYINQGKNAARYTASQLSTIKGKIKAAMHKHGHGVNIAASAGAEPPVLAQLREGEAWVLLAAAPTEAQSIAMRHSPFTGKHSHAHHVTLAHDHEHSHAGDSEHVGSVHGANRGQKAWAAKGESSWGDRHAYTALAATVQGNQSSSSGAAGTGGMNAAAAGSGSGLSAAASGSTGGSPPSGSYTGPAIGAGAGHIHGTGTGSAASSGGRRHG